MHHLRLTQNVMIMFMTLCSPGSHDKRRLSARWPANPQTKPTDLGCESADKWLLPSTSTIAICYYYSAGKLIYSFYRPTEGGKLSRPRHCSKGAQSVSKAVHRSGCSDKYNCRGENRTWVPSHRSQACITTRVVDHPTQPGESTLTVT